jgi:hypothetical protein
MKQGKIEKVGGKEELLETVPEKPKCCKLGGNE